VAFFIFNKIAFDIFKSNNVIFLRAREPDKYYYPFLKWTGMLLTILMFYACHHKHEKKEDCSFCDQYLALNYGNCEACRYSSFVLYLRIPGKIQLTIDSIVHQGTPQQKDTSFTRMGLDTIHYHQVVPSDFPFTVKIGTNTVTQQFTLDKQLYDSISTCLSDIPGTIFYDKVGITANSWIVFNNDSSKIFTGNLRVNPDRECITIELNKK
jgi:hypothetical protein